MTPPLANTSGLVGLSKLFTMKASSKCHLRLTPTAVADVLPVIVLSALSGLNCVIGSLLAFLFFYIFFFSPLSLSLSL